VEPTTTTVEPTTTTVEPTTTTSVASAEPPANDDYANAAVIVTLPFTDENLDTTAATAPPDDPSSSCGIPSNTVWYAGTAGVDKVVEANTFGSNYDTILIVATGSPGNFTVIDCNDDSGISGNEVQSQVTFNAVAGETYYFIVGSKGAGGGNLVFNVNDGAQPTTTTVEPTTTTVEPTTTTVEPTTTTTPPVTTTTTTSGGGGGGGGGGTSITTTAQISTSTTTSTISGSTTTSTISGSTTTTTHAECSKNADCADDDYCNGSESCVAGTCVSSGNPCDPEQQSCSSELQTCVDIVKILNVPTALLPRRGERNLRAPILLPKLCYWLRVTIDEENNIDIYKSKFSIEGEATGYSGVEISDSRIIHDALLRRNKGKVFWVPISVYKNATPGTWKIKIETDRTDAAEPFIEIVEGPFIVRENLFER
jgi:hypothetical protein